MLNKRIHIVALGVEDIDISLQFYKKGFGFSESFENKDIVYFQTQGTILEIYKHNLKKSDLNTLQTNNGLKLIHNVSNLCEINTLLQQAEHFGGKIIKPISLNTWGGYNSYILDPDGYCWVITYWDKWNFSEEGALLI